MAGILDSLTASYKFLTNNDETLRATWGNGIPSFDFWYRQAHEIAETVGRHRKSLSRNSSLFAEQLFRNGGTLQGGIFLNLADLRTVPLAL